ncbi:MAG: peptidase MA family metallohydrolase [Anaerolineae bacterium]
MRSKVVRKGVFRLLALILLLALSGLALSLLTTKAVLAQEPIRIKEVSQEYRFSERIVFHIAVEADNEIVEASVFYKYADHEGAVTSRGDAEFTPAKEISTQYEKELDRGDIPPGTEMEYYWRVEDVVGNKLKTKPFTFTYMDDRFNWLNLSQGKITLYWYEGSQAYGTRLLNMAMKALARLEGEAGVELEKTAKIFVYANKGDMSAAMPSRGEVFDARTVTLGTVVAPNTLLLLGEQEAVDRTLAHELSHLVVGLATKNPYSRIPAWLNEGLAMYAEGELRGGNAAALAAAIAEDSLISVQSLSASTGDPGQINLFYGEAYSVVEFLLEGYGPEKMSELLAVFKRGSLTEDALQEVYGFGVSELDALWRQSLGLQPRQVDTVEEPTTPLPTAVPPTATKPREGLCASLLPTTLLLMGAAFVSRAKASS